MRKILSYYKKKKKKEKEKEKATENDQKVFSDKSLTSKKACAKNWQWEVLYWMLKIIKKEKKN